MLDYKGIVGIGRGRTPEQWTDHTPPTLAEIFVDRVTGPYNKDVIYGVEGQRGEGKSTHLLYLADKCAHLMVKKLGGCYADYFSMDNVAVITQVKEKLRNTKPYQIIILDDLGAKALSNRRWMTEESEDLNAVIQVMRPQNNIVLFSVPEKSMGDLRLRSFTYYHGQIAEHMHFKGMSLVKVTTHKKLQNGKIIFPYIRFQRKKIVRFISRKPPEALQKAYDETRNRLTREIMESADRTDGKQPSRREQHWQDMINLYQSRIQEMLTDGLTPYQMQGKLGIQGAAVKRIIEMTGMKP